MTAQGERLLSIPEVAERVDDVANAIAGRIDDDWVVVCLLTGGLWFTADLTRALSRLGRNPLFDALWLSSYGDAREACGVEVRAGLQRGVQGRGVLIVDDVADSGASIAAAKRLALAAGASQVLTAVFARKPWPAGRELEPDFVAWDAPARFLAGYGMDLAGRFRGLGHIMTVD